MKSVFTVALIGEFTSVIAHAPYHRPTDNAIGLDKPGNDISKDTGGENTRDEVAQGNFPDVGGKGAGGSYSAFVQLHDSHGFDDSTEFDSHNADHGDELPHGWSPHGELYGPYFANGNAPDGPSLGRMVEEEGAKHGSSAVELHNADVHDAGFYDWDEHSEMHGEHDSSDGVWGHFTSYLGDFFGFDEGTSFLGVRNINMKTLGPNGAPDGEVHPWNVDLDDFQADYWQFLKKKDDSIAQPVEITAERLDMFLRERFPMSPAEPIKCAGVSGAETNILLSSTPFSFGKLIKIQFKSFYQIGDYQLITPDNMELSAYMFLGAGASGSAFAAIDTRTVTTTEVPAGIKFDDSNQATTVTIAGTSYALLKMVAKKADANDETWLRGAGDAQEWVDSKADYAITLTMGKTVAVKHMTGGDAWKSNLAMITAMMQSGVDAEELKNNMILMTGQHEFAMMNKFVGKPGVIQMQAAYDLSEGDASQDITAFTQDVYLVLEYADAGNWAEHPPKTELDACAQLLQVMVGLTTVHAQGVVHKDINPKGDNVFVFKSGNHYAMKLADLGNARGPGDPGYDADKERDMQKDIGDLLAAFQAAVVFKPGSPEYERIHDGVHLEWLRQTTEVGVFQSGFSDLAADFLIHMHGRFVGPEGLGITFNPSTATFDEVLKISRTGEVISGITGGVDHQGRIVIAATRIDGAQWDGKQNLVKFSGGSGATRCSSVETRLPRPSLKQILRHPFLDQYFDAKNRIGKFWTSKIQGTSNLQKYKEQFDDIVQFIQDERSIDSFTVPGGKRESISFANGEYANLNADETPTTVTATDKDDTAHENRVLVSMKYATESGDVVEWVSGTAQSFIVGSGDSDIHFVTKLSPMQQRHERFQDATAVWETPTNPFVSMSMNVGRALQFIHALYRELYKLTPGDAPKKLQRHMMLRKLDDMAQAVRDNWGFQKLSQPNGELTTPYALTKGQLQVLKVKKRKARRAELSRWPAAPNIARYLESGDSQKMPKWQFCNP